MIKEIAAKHDDEKRRTQITFDDYKRKVSHINRMAIYNTCR